jgi:hypothetical protein
VYLEDEAQSVEKHVVSAIGLRDALFRNVVGEERFLAFVFKGAAVLRRPARPYSSRTCKIHAFPPYRTNELCCPPVVAEKLVVVEAPDAVRARRLESIFRLEPPHRVEVSAKVSKCPVNVRFSEDAQEMRPTIKDMAMRTG